MSAAAKLLRISVDCGYRESGISATALNTPQEKVIVAIRTTAIRAEIPLASYDVHSARIRPFGLTRQYLVSLLTIINKKFVANGLRKQKLHERLSTVFDTNKAQLPNETKEERRNRKRLEGLRTQAARKEKQTPLIETHSSPKLDILSDNTHIDQLITL